MKRIKKIFEKFFFRGNVVSEKTTMFTVFNVSNTENKELDIENEKATEAREWCLSDEDTFNIIEQSMNTHRMMFRD